MLHNNKMNGMDLPAEKMTGKGFADILGAMGTLLTLCPAMVTGVQMLTRIL